MILRPQPARPETAPHWPPSRLAQLPIEPLVGWDVPLPIASILGWSAPPPIVQRAAAPTWSAAGTAVYSNTGAALSPAWPAGYSDGHVALAFHMSEQFFADPGAATLSTANGFTVIGSALGVRGTGRVRVTVAWARASGSMSAPTWAAAGQKTAAVIQTYSGCISSGAPYDVTSVSSDGSGSSTATIPGTTTTVDDVLVVIGVATYNASPGSTSFSSWTNADLTSVTERSDDSDATNGQAIATATGELAAHGAYGSTTATMTATQAFAGMTIALQPEPPAANPFRPIGSAIVKRFPGVLGSPVVRAFSYAPASSASSDPPDPPTVFDAVFSAAPSLMGRGFDYVVELAITASGEAQTDGAVRVVVRHDTEAGTGPMTLDLDGWTESGWTQDGSFPNIWYNDLTRAAVAVGTTNPLFQINYATAGTVVMTTADNTSPFAFVHTVTLLAPTTNEASGPGQVVSAPVVNPDYEEIYVEYGGDYTFFIVGTTTSSSTWPASAPIPVTIFASANRAGTTAPQDNGEFWVRCEGPITSVATDSLDGWTEDGWSDVGGGVWENRYARAAVSDGETNPTFTITPDGTTSPEDTITVKTAAGSQIPNTDQVPFGGHNTLTLTLT